MKFGIDPGVLAGLVAALHPYALTLPWPSQAPAHELVPATSRVPVSAPASVR
ncbi:hypothetical protein ACFY4C_41765 [Actinomadura viridis]|uniref:hypothetical protein n=1 Tax=Actinomadura viridis TaxID=58110 RepID=UPI00368F0406